MSTDVFTLPADVGIAPDLRSAYRESRLLTLVLDSGERFVVTPEKDLEALHALFSDPKFAAALERSLTEVQQGDFEVLDDDEN